MKVNRFTHWGIGCLCVISLHTTFAQVELLDDGMYTLRDKEFAEKHSLNPSVDRQYFIQDRVDSLIFTYTNENKATEEVIIRMENMRAPLRLRNRLLDVDVFTIPFKIRSSRADMPIQLNTNFNGAVYIGRRQNQYTLSTSRVTRRLAERKVAYQGFGYGFFFGLGSTSVDPFVTRDKITYEYEGMILHAGIAGIYDVRIFNLGLAFGIDHLVDRNRNYWIYQHQPWIGVLFGLDIN